MDRPPASPSRTYDRKSVLFEWWLYPRVLKYTAPEKSKVWTSEKKCKPATVSFDGDLFWLNRINAATKGKASDASQAYICIPHALILHSSFIADSDGGSLLLRLLAPPTGVERSSIPPFKLSKSRAARVVEMRTSLDKENIHQPTRRLSAQLSGPCSNLRLVKIEARLAGQDAAALSDEASAWAEKLTQLAYPDTKPYRRLKVIVNPIGGPGKAVQLYKSRVLPILDAAGCTVDATITTHAFHGQEIAETFSLDENGDGMLHEVLNGLAKRKDAEIALQIPLVPIPAGSGNAVALNLLGVDQGFNLALASLNAIKGKPMPVDVCCVTQPIDPTDVARKAKAAAKRRSMMRRKNTSESIPTSTNGSTTEAEAMASPAYDVGYSFLSQAIGVLANCDLGTEHLRMLGDTRFVLGFIGEVLSNKECEVDVYVKLGTNGTINKSEMRARVQATFDERESENQKSGQHQQLLNNGSVLDSLGEDLPTLIPIDPSWPKSVLGTDGTASLDPSQWYRIQAPISSLYAGKIPYVARDLMQFPFALSHDGCIDLTLLLHDGGRAAKLRGISAAETGIVVYDPAMVYIKCEAYRVVPRLEAGHRRLKMGGLISIDGESKPYRPFQVEIGQFPLRFLSLFGRWLTPDVPPPDSDDAKNKQL
ncbi:uncharacterized protein FA14DRAFT_164097 [Meira miltonrushii]|uniref:DAGKc domain-containing protein n=1 Tax=Meira miltonrushii TaxID=1280837 RepID=A0A316VBJ3_9BASI|nr:uncharacterized protein FA14DRAFT_164097 [Meira miltonrushii]PWN34932.1 hypothetical protein FA14DRAFT_164097 [Meira miltonrushii]